MNRYEARLDIVRRIRSVLVDLADGEDLNSVEFAELEQSMTDAAEIVLEALGLDVIDVTAEGILATLSVTEPAV
jgi:hypothetical protein